MNQNLMFDFKVDKEAKQITVHREFAAETPLVWDAYTKSEILDRWWAPKPWKAQTKSMDFREGGSWLYAMVGPNGEKHWSIVEYLRISARKSYTSNDAFCDEEGNINKEMGQSKWEVTFTPKANHTLVELKLSFKDLAQLESLLKMGFREGLAMAMENLDELLASKKN